jgi:hypothetical protein
VGARLELLPLALTGQLAEKFLLIHAVLEGFASVDEDDRDFVVELPPEFTVAIHIYFVPDEAPAARKFAKTLFHHFAQMAALSRVNHDLSLLQHEWIVALS